MRTTDPVLSAHEIADELHVHYETALGYIRAGHIPGVKRGKRWYVRRSALDAFLEPDTSRATA